MLAVVTIAMTLGSVQTETILSFLTFGVWMATEVCSCEIRVVASRAFMAIPLAKE
jgi:hypothetical protein